MLTEDKKLFSYMSEYIVKNVEYMMEQNNIDCNELSLEEVGTLVDACIMNEDVGPCHKADDYLLERKLLTARTQTLDQQISQEQNRMAIAHAKQIGSDDYNQLIKFKTMFRMFRRKIRNMYREKFRNDAIRVVHERMRQKQQNQSHFKRVLN